MSDIDNKELLRLEKWN